MKKKLVLKIGTSTLTAETDRVSRGKIEDIARQLSALKNEYDIVLVSSGAIATAKQFISVHGNKNLNVSKPALAAIGQPLLMQVYNEIFRDFGLKTAQCLLTYMDFQHATAKENTFNTITELLKHDYIPIINENDTVAIEEIILGDNDKLSALMANLIDADLLVLASDIDGVFDKNPHLDKTAKLILEIKNLEDIKQYVQEKNAGLGTGGMMSKIIAAEICYEKKIEMWIVNGGRKNFLLDALENKINFTKFLR